MEKVLTASDIGKLLNIHPSTVKLWEQEKLIPTATRVGRAQKRVWGKSKVLLILEYARDMAGYPIPDGIFDLVRGTN